MKTTSYSSTVIRILTVLAILAVILMLYWSNVLIESDLKTVISELRILRSEIDQLREEIDEIELQPVSTRQGVQKNPADDDLTIEGKNLLAPDPFYQTTLPALLGADFKPQGTLRQATIGRPKTLHPFSGWSEVNDWRTLCTVPLSSNKFGIYETLAPQMAVKMVEKEDSANDRMEYWISLRSDVYWEPLRDSDFQGIRLAKSFKERQAVTAHDYKFYFDALMNPFNEELGAVALRNYYEDLEEIEVVDDRTLIVKWRMRPVGPNGEKKVRYIAKEMTGSLTPLPSFVFKYFANGEKIIEEDDDPDTYRKNSIWAQNFSHHWAKNVIVSCGPWSFSGMSDSGIKLLRNSRFFNPYAALIHDRYYQFKESPDTIWQAFKAGKVDFITLQPKQLMDLNRFLDSEEYKEQKKAGKAIRKLDYLVRSYSYIGWNEKTPYFSSRKTRRAMTMAIDRRRIIDHILNGMGKEITGPFFVESEANDPSVEPFPYDPDLSKRLLAEEGWIDHDNDGIIDKEIEGEFVPFSFSLTYYVKNPVTAAICEYVSTALKEVGVQCTLNGLDLSDLSATFEEKSFDAISLAWSLGTPPEEPKQLWHSFGADKKGSSNAVGFSNREADAIIEQLQFEYDNEKRTSLYHRFHRIIHEEQPYTFLYTPKTTLLYRELIKNVFIPAERQDLIPGANVSEPQSSIFWIDQ